MEKQEPVEEQKNNNPNPTTTTTNASRQKKPRGNQRINSGSSDNTSNNNNSNNNNSNNKNNNKKNNSNNVKEVKYIAQTLLPADRTPYPFVDSHVHLDMIITYNKPFEIQKNHLEELIDDNFTDKTIYSLCNSIPESSKIQFLFDGCVQVCCFTEGYSPTELLMSLNRPNIYASYGIHPHSAKEYNTEIENKIIALMDHPKTVAWGECGLDFFKNISEQDVQIEAFKRQLTQAVKLKKPIVVHTRSAEEKTVEVMKEIVPKDHKVHMHCFGESIDMTQKLLEHWSENMFFGFTGAITFNSAEKNRSVVKYLPLEKILLETDGPFMAPVPLRGKVAHCGMIPLVAKKIAEIKGVSLEQVLKTTRENTKKMYGF